MFLLIAKTGLEDNANVTCLIRLQTMTSVMKTTHATDKVNVNVANANANQTT